MAKAAVKSTARRGGNPALRLAAIRQIHVYLAMFIAPSVIFFALTGAVQLFSLHEAHGDYKPAPVIEKLGMLHKDQVFKTRGERKGPPKAVKASPGAGDHDAGPAKPATPIKVLALKWLFLAVSLALAVSTALGVWMGLLYNRRKGVALVLLLAGAAAPVLLVIL
ncbi:MAG: hypothetical protein P4L64_01980 [Caulobacteraceae bacterium]|nr:hypothetical protein [Caulobacteraceae bacterium]